MQQYKLGDLVSHPSDLAPFKVVGIRENELEIEGDFSGGTHNVCQRGWEPIDIITRIETSNPFVMQQYRQKHEIVEAEQFFGGNIILGREVVEHQCDYRMCLLCGGDHQKHLVVTGTSIILQPGNWLVRFAKGNMLSYSKESFERVFEPVSAPSVPDSQHDCTLTDQELIVVCEEWIQKLIDSGGKEWCMFVPARPNKDPDLLFSELVERFKAKLSQPQSEGGLQWAKGRYDELYRQVKSGIETPCLVDYRWDENTVCRDICRIKPHNLELSSRGHCYGSIFMRPGRSEEQEFISMCKSANVEWIPAASPSTANTEEGADPRLIERIAIEFLDDIRDYERENGVQVCFDERSSEELFEIFKSEYRGNYPKDTTKEQQIAFAEWLAENTEIIRTEKITLYRYCDKMNEWGNYTLEDIHTVFSEL